MKIIRPILMLVMILFTLSMVIGCQSTDLNTDQLDTASSSEPDLASIPLGQALSSGEPTLAEFGWRTCVPCKEMKPILEELAVEYQGKLNVVIVEVYDQMELTGQYGITAIPTQIVFDNNGNEITRHIGFWPKDDIIAQLQEMGIE